MHRSVDIFNIHAKIMDDYKHFVSSFINIKNERIREVVEAEIDAGKYWPEPLILQSANLTDHIRAGFLESELENVAELGEVLDAIALQRAEILIDAHERFRKVLGRKRFKVAEPVLTVDLMGIYILLPDRGINSPEGAEKS